MPEWTQQEIIAILKNHIEDRIPAEILVTQAQLYISTINDAKGREELQRFRIQTAHEGMLLTMSFISSTPAECDGLIYRTGESAMFMLYDRFFTTINFLLQHPQQNVYHDPTSPEGVLSALLVLAWRDIRNGRDSREIYEELPLRIAEHPHTPA